VVDIDPLRRQVRARVQEMPVGRVLARPPAPTRYLFQIERTVRVLGWGHWTATLWISPDELRVERKGVLHAASPRGSVVATSYRWGGPVWRRLTVTTADGADWPLCLVAGPTGWWDVDDSLARAGWPTGGRRLRAGPVSTDRWWTMCRVDGSTGWFVVEPGWLAVETPATVAWWSRRQAPDVRLHAARDGLHVEVRAAGAEPVVAVVPHPGGWSLGAALEAGGWSARA
jgi:hypothetical protein